MKVPSSLVVQAQQDQVCASPDIWSRIIHMPDTIPRYRLKVVLRFVNVMGFYHILKVLHPGQLVLKNPFLVI